MAILIIGNSDGIGLALTRLLLKEGRTVIGISRSPLPDDLRTKVEHTTLDVTHPDYAATLSGIYTAHTIEACVYCVGIGDPIDLNNLSAEHNTFAVNLMAAVTTVEALLPHMLKANAGHIVALSSLADVGISPEAPSYAASKAGLSSYLEGLALAVRSRGIFITNVRFGFVDTKMAKSPVKPLVMTANKAARKVRRCLDTKPIRYSAPLPMAALVHILRWLTVVRIWWS